MNIFVDFLAKFSDCGQRNIYIINPNGLRASRAERLKQHIRVQKNEGKHNSYI